MQNSQYFPGDLNTFKNNTTSIFNVHESLQRVKINLYASKSLNSTEK